MKLDAHTILKEIRETLEEPGRVWDEDVYVYVNRLIDRLEALKDDNDGGGKA